MYNINIDVRDQSHINKSVIQFNTYVCHFLITLHYFTLKFTCLIVAPTTG